MPLGLRGFLQSAGHDAHTVSEENLSRVPDKKLLTEAGKEERVLLTFDLDFANVRDYPPSGHGGIVVFRLRDQRWKTMETHARQWLRYLASANKALTIVEETRIRVHRAKGS